MNQTHIYLLVKANGYRCETLAEVSGVAREDKSKELLRITRWVRPARYWALAQGPLIVRTLAWVPGGGMKAPSNRRAQGSHSRQPPCLPTDV